MTESFFFPRISTVGWQTIFSLCVLAFLIVHISQSILSYRRLRAFKGPLWASLSQTWLAHQTITGGLYLTLRDVSEKYGK